MPLKEILNTNSIEENRVIWNSVAQPHLTTLLLSPKKYKKKILEVCHAAKLLMLLGKEPKILQCGESPDFIINDGNSNIGLEHIVIIDSEVKESEGFIENIFDKVEGTFQKDSALPNFFANCQVKSGLHLTHADRPRLTAELDHVIRRFLSNPILIPNALVDHISIMPHSQINISPNFGAWFQKWITDDILQSTIVEKELKLDSYRQNFPGQQWLLLVIGSIGNSSYEVNYGLEVEASTKFDRVFLLEDFKNRLYELIRP